MIRSGMVSFHEDLKPLMVPINSVKPHDQNYNRGDVEAITASIETNGMFRPIYVQRSSNKIIAGNHTHEACLSLGAETIPVVFLDVDDTEAYRVMVADNRTASLAQPDNDALLAILKGIEATSGYGLEGTGYTQADLEVLEHLAEINTEPLEFAQWPTITIQVPPHVRKAYYEMTEEAMGERERFELVLRLAGWNGK